MIRHWNSSMQSMTQHSTQGPELLLIIAISLCIGIQLHWPWNQWIEQTKRLGTELWWMWYVLPNFSCLCQPRGIMRRKKWHWNGKGTWLLTVRHYETQCLKISTFNITASIYWTGGNVGMQSYKEWTREQQKELLLSKGTKWRIYVWRLFLWWPIHRWNPLSSHGGCC